jgi:hypothetical protein
MGATVRLFTYLPLVYQDDCQVSESEANFEEDATPSYTVEITLEITFK